MVNWKNKKKKEKILCGGKLVLTDFGKLDPQMFQPNYDYSKEQLREELSVFMPDGRIFINSENENCELYAGIFEYLIPESRYILEQYKKEMKRRFPGIKSFDDWLEWAGAGQDKENIVPVLAALMVPTEFKRRDMERMYYRRK